MSVVWNKGTLADTIRAAAKEIMDRADEFAGNDVNQIDMDIHIYFTKNAPPTIEFHKELYPQGVFVHT